MTRTKNPNIVKVALTDYWKVTPIQALVKLLCDVKTYVVSSDGHYFIVSNRTDFITYRNNNDVAGTGREFLDNVVSGKLLFEFTIGTPFRIGYNSDQFIVWTTNAEELQSTLKEMAEGNIKN